MSTATVAALTEYTAVPRLCDGGTAVCIASGPSLTAEDVSYCQGRADVVVVVNNNYKLAPWATALYAADATWWNWHKGAPDFAGLKYSVGRHAAKWPGVQILRNTGDMGLETNPTGLRTGRNSGYQAVNLAVHLGANRIILLGYDMQRGQKGEWHWHGTHPQHTSSPLTLFVNHFKRLPDALEPLGITVVNCSRATALTCFDRAPLETAL